jgi:hypothetical protein
VPRLHRPRGRTGPLPHSIHLDRIYVYIAFCYMYTYVDRHIRLGIRRTSVSMRPRRDPSAMPPDCVFLDKTGCPILYECTS